MKRRLLILSFLALSACGAGDADRTVTRSEPAVAVDEESITASCITCHGRDGASSKGGAPFLAGQHQDYMVSAIRDYVIGTRQHEFMRDYVVGFTDEERLAVTDYFARMDTPWKGVEKPKVVDSNKVSKRAIAAGRRIARQCTSCHGDKGISTRPGVPNLAGLQPDYFKRSLRAYLSGERTGAEIMKNFKYSLSKRDIDSLAAYFSSLKMQRTGLTVQGSVKWGRESAQRCVGCHGAGGNSINPDIPSLAGQNGRYLKIAMQHYRDGERKNSMMRKAVANFSDTKISNLAAYYSRQKPVRAGSGESGKPGVFDPIADGARLAASCDGCHGKNGSGGQRGIPRLAGLFPAYLMQAIQDYKSGARKNQTMQMFTTNLSDLAIEKVSLFYATQAPGKSAQQGKADLAAGETLSEGCAACHGEKGVSSDPKVPSLAGQDARYLTSAIHEYATGKRAVEAMTDAVKELDKQAVSDVASYYASLTGEKPAVRIPEGPEHWVEKCQRCHGLAGYSQQADKPILTGQLQSYLVSSLKAYRDGTRRHSTMNAMLAEMSLSEIHALAAYYARQGKPSQAAIEAAAQAKPAEADQ